MKITRHRTIEPLLTNARAIGWSWWLCALALLLGSGYLLSGPVWDVDSWWHLASGREIVVNGALPKSDTLTAMIGPIDEGRFYLLKAYWLAQVIFYAFYSAFGLFGLVLLRLAILLMIPLLLIIQAAWYRLPATISLIGAVLCVWMMTDYTGERPQLFSFCLLVPLLMLLEAIGYARREGFAGYRLQVLWVIGFLLAFWSNLHPGFLLGVVVLGIYLCGELIKGLFLRYPVSLQALRNLSVGIGLAMACSLVNPNGPRVFLGLIHHEGSVIQAKSPEYLSLLAAYRVYGQIPYPFLLTLVTFAVLLLLARRRVDFSRALLLACLAGIGMAAFRYAPFFVISAATLLPRECSILDFLGRRTYLAGCGIAAVGVAVVLLILCGQKTDSLFTAGSDGTVRRDRFPQASAVFFQAGNLTGPIFNHFDWGGFLGWQLAPSHKVFIDGRNLSSGKFSEYTHALWTPGAWRKVFARYGIATVIMPRINRASGELYHLTKELAEADDWALVYIDNCAMVLTPRDGTRPIPGEIPKSIIYRYVVDDVQQIMKFKRKSKNGLLALTYAYAKLGMINEAREAGEAANRL